jgi:phosphoribosylanthranilate isomerase
MHTRIKICCIASPEEARMALAHGADAIGLVGRMPSGPGPIEDDLIREIATGVAPPVARFLLTSETRANAIAAHVRYCGIDTVQIVSHVEPIELMQLAELVPEVRRVQVIHIEDHTALDRIDAYAPHVHAFLLDSGRPSATIPELGGTGRVHDWQISAEFVARSPHPVFLAGGLNPANVADAIRQVKPYGVDICSGVRTDGRLDAEKLARYVAAIRGALLH